MAHVATVFVEVEDGLVAGNGGSLDRSGYKKKSGDSPMIDDVLYQHRAAPFRLEDLRVFLLVSAWLALFYTRFLFK